jgi:hypothetical protein
MIATLRRLAALSFLFAIAAAANATSVPIVSINPATDITSGPRGPGQFFGFNEANVDGTIGYRFNILSPIVVTDVGWYDQDGDGLAHSHAIGLWQSDGQSPLDGPYRKAAIPNGPLTLPPGAYILGGTDTTFSPDVIRYALDRVNPFFAHTMPTDPRIDLGQPAYSQSPTLHVPDTFLLVDGVELGPMLFVVPVPEPASIALLYTALCLIPARRPERPPDSHIPFTCIPCDSAPMGEILSSKLPIPTIKLFRQPLVSHPAVP